jgi:hypothetical protein
MLAQFRLSYTLIVVAVLIGAVGCASTMTARTSGEYIDDARIATDVSSKLATDPALNATRIGVTSTNGIVYLSGAVPSSDRLARATHLARQVPGVQSVVNNMVVSAPPIRTTVTAPPTAQVVASPPVNIASGQPAIDATGIVTRYDPQSGIVTFQDGRMVRVTTGSAVAGPAGVVAFQPGTQVILRNVQPVGYQPTTVPASGSWRMGTVTFVDAANGLIYLHDGSVVRVGPSTMLRSGAQPITLAQLQQGSQIAISVPTTTVTESTTTTVTVTPAPATGATITSGSALPRQTVVPLETPEVRIFVLPR